MPAVSKRKGGSRFPGFASPARRPLTAACWSRGSATCGVTARQTGARARVAGVRTSLAGFSTGNQATPASRCIIRDSVRTGCEHVHVSRLRGEHSREKIVSQAVGRGIRVIRTNLGGVIVSVAARSALGCAVAATPVGAKVIHCSAVDVAKQRRMGVGDVVVGRAGALKQQRLSTAVVDSEPTGGETAACGSARPYWIRTCIAGGAAGRRGCITNSAGGTVAASAIRLDSGKAAKIAVKAPVLFADVDEVRDGAILRKGRDAHQQHNE